ncbi:MAG: hypothetical protein QNJ41_16135 [Xenococcaceae cyanobacterium MO_188.B32]|nr:hypothetical protein [Xenococcaceae cyanobacterium MO_188.B32]
MKKTLVKFSSLLSLTILLFAIYNPINGRESKSEQYSNNQELTQSELFNSISLSNKNSTKIAIPPIEWGVLSNYFAIENVKTGMHQEVDPYTGRVEEVPLLTFTVEAKRRFYTTLFFARFYDSEDIEIGFFSPIEFKPLYDTWNQGMRSRANIILLRNMSDVAVIKLSQL